MSIEHWVPVITGVAIGLALIAIWLQERRP